MTVLSVAGDGVKMQQQGGCSEERVASNVFTLLSLLTC